MNNTVTKTITIPKDKEPQALVLIKLLESCLEFSSKDDLNQIIEEIQPKLFCSEDIELTKEIAGDEYVEEINPLLYLANLKGKFDLKRSLIASSLTTTQVQDLIGCQSISNVYDRLKANTLIGLKHNGQYHFPIWQFDPDGENNVLDGLPKLLTALEEISNFAQLIWLTKPLKTFDNKIPWQILKSGNLQEIESLVIEARGVSVSQ